MKHITLRDLTNCLMVMGGDETRNGSEMKTLATQLAGHISITGHQDKLSGLKDMVKACESMIVELQATVSNFNEEIKLLEQDK